MPVCFAAKLLNIPIVAHESDFSFGLANKIILKTCNVMCVNFSNLEGKNKKIIYTGPIFSNAYESTYKDYSKLNLDKTKPTLLIVGGSLGSKKINDNIFADGCAAGKKLRLAPLAGQLFLKDRCKRS